MRHKTLALAYPYGNDPVVQTPELVERVRADWQRASGLVAWLAQALGDE